MISTIIAMILSGVTVFLLIGKALTEYQVNDLNRIKIIQREVYFEIAVTLCFFLLLPPAISAVVLHYITIKFMFLSTINYETLLSTDINEP